MTMVSTDHTYLLLLVERIQRFVEEAAPQLSRISPVRERMSPKHSNRWLECVHLGAIALTKHTTKAYTSVKSH